MSQPLHNLDPGSRSWIGPQDAIAALLALPRGMHAGGDNHDRLPDFEHMAYRDIQQSSPLASSTQPNVIKFPQLSPSPLGSAGWPVVDSLVGNNPNSLDNTTSSLLNLDQLEAWLTSTDFDLSAFHSSMLNATLEGNVGRLHSDEVDPDHPTKNTRSPGQAAVRRHWFTFLLSHDSGNTAADVVSERNEVDETCRQNLSQRLMPRVPQEPLPSTDFLVPNPFFNSIAGMTDTTRTFASRHTLPASTPSSLLSTTRPFGLRLKARCYSFQYALLEVSSWELPMLCAMDRESLSS